MALRAHRASLLLGVGVLIFCLLAPPMHSPWCVSSSSTPNIWANFSSTFSGQETDFIQESVSISKSRIPPTPPSPVTNYSIDAFLQPWNNIVNGSTTINYVNHADDSLAELYFHLYPNAFNPEGWIEIFYVQYDGAPLSYTITGSDDTLLYVNLTAGSGPGVLASGQNVTLDIMWQVMIPEAYDRFAFTNRTEPYEFLGYNLGNWHPIVSVYDDRGWDLNPYSFMGESFYSDVAVYDVEIGVPADYVVAATGELQSITSGVGTRIWHFETGLVRDFTWCASPHYQTMSQELHGVNVTSYHLAEHELGGQRALQIADECLEVYGNLYGPYAWKSLHIVEADIWAGGMEYPQLIMIGAVLYGGYEGLSSLAIVVAHEIAHEWVPFTIGTDSFTEPWIDEGFASYSEYTWVDDVYGLGQRASYRLNDLNRYWEYVGDEGDKSLNQSMMFWQSIDWYAYGNIVYAKAALVLDLLRYQLGNAAFYQAWQDIYSQAIHENIRARTLQQYFETSVGESLDWFFDPWVYNSGVVTLSLGAITLSPSVDGWTISLTLLQSASTPVRLRVPLAISFGLTSEVIWIWMEATPVTVHSITVSGFPLQLTLDPERLLICQYGTRIHILALAPGSPALYGLVGLIAVVAITASILIIRKRRKS